MKQREKGKSNLHVEEAFSDKLDSLKPYPRLSKLIKKYSEEF